MSDSPGTVLLEVSGVTKRFGGILANDHIDLTMRSGEIVGLIGPNGAGKTTLFNMLGGVRPEGHKRGADSGVIAFDGTDITHLPAHTVCRLGVGRAFQIVKVFDHMDVLSNIAVGAMVRYGSLVEAEQAAEGIVDLVGLASRARVKAGSLTLVDRKRVEVARALATQPKLLMLDEVMAGLTPAEVGVAVELVRSINETGVTVLMVEHVLEAVMALSERVVVLHQGRVIADSPPDVVVQDPTVIDAYLGHMK
ncbi:MAG: ATP-binding cassette domain-containing protein [Acidimicrobiia bacterium]|nr:ATP-binding cassette domain-containing protein [Acidimicrobiia bacterium]